MRDTRPRIEPIMIDGIEMRHDRRQLSAGPVDALASSLTIGLRIPISVRLVVFEDENGDPDGIYHLITGAHRMAAAKKLGWDYIDAFVYKNESDDYARLWEIAENLHRAELTALERSKQIAEWVRLTDKVANLRHLWAAYSLPTKVCAKHQKSLA